MNTTDEADTGGAPLRDKNRQMHRRILSLVHTLQVRAEDALDYEHELHATLAETWELPGILLDNWQRKSRGRNTDD